MKVLFVSSGNSANFKILPFIQSQGESLAQKGIDLEFFTIQQKGIRGYISASKQLKQYLKTHKFDLIHAHYSLSAWTVVLARPKVPIVLSLMGSDAYGDYIGKNKITLRSRLYILLTYLIQPFVQAIICKSKHIQKSVFLKKKSYVIPNGIDMSKILSYNGECKTELGLDSTKQYILFLGSKSDIRKNFPALKKAFEIIHSPDISLIAPYPLSHELVYKYLNSADVLVVPSFMEGSPNIVKEAMACNCPVVATDVGDIRWLFGEEEGYFLTGFSPEEIAEKITSALQFSKSNKRTNGRNRIIELGLESHIVADKIIQIYNKVLSRKNESY